MTPFKVKPICAAIMLMTASALPAMAQTTGDSTSGNGAGDQGAEPVAKVEVTGIRKSLRTAEQIKRDSVQVVDAINADDIGKFPDRQAGDALQRVAGVQVQRDRGETSGVIIRGLPDVATTINGNEIFTGNGRRLAYQDLPVQSIAGLDVYKSATANQFEGGIAGAINVRLRAPFDFKEFTATGFVEDRHTKVTGSSATKAKNNPGGGFLVSNRWDTGAGEMGLLFDVAYNKDHWGYPVQWVDRPDRVFSVSPDGTATRLDDGKIAPLKPGDVLGELPNIGGIYNAGDRDRGSIHGAFQWKISPRLEASAQYLGTGYRGRSEVDYILAITTWAPKLYNVKLAPQGDYCKTPEGVICPIRSADAPPAKWGAGPYDYDPYFATSTWGVKEHTNTHYLDFGLQYRDGPLSVVSNAAYTQSKFVNDTIIVDQQIPGVTASVYAYGADGHGGYNSISTASSPNALRDPNAFVLRGLVQNWAEQEGKQLQWRTDATYRMDMGILSGIDAGLRLSEHKASFHSAEGHSDVDGRNRPNPVAAFGSSFENLVPGLDRLGGPWLTPSRDYLIDQADKVRQVYGAPAGRVADDPTRLFEQRERTTTLYAAARWKADLAGVDVTGNVGARLVHVNRNLRGKNQIGNVVSDVDLSTSETNVLPSASAIVGWSDQWQSHVSVGKTITRPEFGAMNPALSLVPGTINAPGSGGAGNPYLKPTESINTDATLEYYFKKNGYAQLAVFHRDIDGYLQNFTQDEVIDGKTYRVSRPQNSGKGKLKGAEFGIQKFFDFLPGELSNFGAQFNYTWITGDNQTRTALNGDTYTTTGLIGVSKQNYNFALLYEGNGLTGRLAATRRGAYVEQIAEPRFGVDRWVGEATFVDLSIGYELTKNVSLQFDGINLTHTKYESYLGDPVRPRDVRYNPTTYGLSLRLKL